MKTRHRFLFAPLGLAAALLIGAAPAGATCMVPDSDPALAGQAAGPALQLPAGWMSTPRAAHIERSDALDLTGFWKFVFVDSYGNVLDFGYATANAGGTELNLSFSHSPISGNQCVGVWRRDAQPHHYKLSHYAPMYAADHLTYIGFVNRVEEVTLSDDGQTTAGRFFTTAYDLQGNILFTREGTSSAIRVKVNTPPLP
jgi:hypothetical protein